MESILYKIMLFACVVALIWQQVTESKNLTQY